MTATEVALGLATVSVSLQAVRIVVAIISLRERRAYWSDDA